MARTQGTQERLQRLDPVRAVLGVVVLGFMVFVVLRGDDPVGLGLLALVGGVAGAAGLYQLPPRPRFAALVVGGLAVFFALLFVYEVTAVAWLVGLLVGSAVGGHVRAVRAG